VILNKPAEIDSKAVKAFDFRKLLSDLEKPRELRKADHKNTASSGTCLPKQGAANGV